MTTQDTFEISFVATNGQTLETRIDGRGGEKLAVLLHGFPECHASWRFQIPLLVKLGYEVWSQNLRGYGQSSKPAGVAAYRVGELIQDVVGLIGQAAAGRPVTLIAHDWGAIIAWALAADKAVELDRLIILNVPHPARMAEGLRTWRQLKKSWYIFFFQLPLLPELALRADGARAIGRAFQALALDQTHFGPEVLQMYRDNALIPGALTAMVNYYRAAARLPDFARYRRETVASIDVPTLMIWGTEDRALGVELTEHYDGLVSDFTLKLVPGVGHWVQQEAPNVVNAHLEAWLTATPVPR